MRLVLAYHTLDEWCWFRAVQARELGCSEQFVEWLTADLRRRWDIPKETKEEAV